MENIRNIFLLKRIVTFSNGASIACLTIDSYQNQIWL